MGPTFGQGLCSHLSQQAALPQHHAVLHLNSYLPEDEASDLILEERLRLKNKGGGD